MIHRLLIGGWQRWELFASPGFAQSHNSLPTRSRCRRQSQTRQCTGRSGAAPGPAARHRAQLPHQLHGHPGATQNEPQQEWCPVLGRSSQSHSARRSRVAAGRLPALARRVGGCWGCSSSPWHRASRCFHRVSRLPPHEVPSHSLPGVLASRGATEQTLLVQHQTKAVGSFQQQPRGI